MKLLLTLSSSDRDADGPSFAVVELTPERASRLLELHRHAIAFVGDMVAMGLASPFFCVSLGSDLAAFDALNYDEVLEEAFGERSESEAIVPFPCGVDMTEDRCCPVECFRVELGQNVILFTALPKHGEFRLTGANIYEQAVTLARATGSPKAS